MPSFHRSFCCTAVVFCAAFASSALAQDATASPSGARVDQILAENNRAQAIGQVAVSPDSKRLAWIQSSEIRLAQIENIAHSDRVTAASAPGQKCTENDFAWSPDSASLVFLSDCGDPGGQSDLYLAHLDGTAPMRLTSLHGDLNAPAFSPDGKSIAFLYVESATRPVGALAAMDAPSGVIGEDTIDVQRVAIVAPAVPQPASVSFATPPNLHVFEFDWSPDSKSIAYIADNPPGENNWWVAKLYTQNLPQPQPAGAPSNATAAQSGDRVGWEAKPIAIVNPSSVSGPLHGLQIALPRWSPDGKSIAFIGGLMSDQGVTGGDVWIVPSAGGEPLNLTPGNPATAEWIAWENNGLIDVGEQASSDSQLVPLNVARREIGAPLFAFPGTVGDGGYNFVASATANRSLFVFAANSFDRAGEIYFVKKPEPKSTSDAKIPKPGSAPQPTQLSNFNDSIKPNWGKSASIEWTNEGFDIQGWLLEPIDYDPAKKYPLIVEVHGGPAAAVDSRWNGDAGGFSATLFSALGYFVLMPNPRGSYGQGEAFTQANRKDFGYGDLRDIEVGIDTVQARYSIDPARIGIAGWSYGGFMTMFALTQTHRFHAGVAGAGISDWLSYYGENSISEWMIPYFGASVYDDPQVYAKSSAINFIKNVSTPTLTLVGDRDGECPAPQSYEFWHALRDLHVPAQLVVYPNEGHGLSDPAHRHDVLQRSVDWFAQYMAPAN